MHRAPSTEHRAIPYRLPVPIAYYLRTAAYLPYQYCHNVTADTRYPYCWLPDCALAFLLGDVTSSCRHVVFLPASFHWLGACLLPALGAASIESASPHANSVPSPTHRVQAKKDAATDFANNIDPTGMVSSFQARLGISSSSSSSSSAAAANAEAPTQSESPADDDDPVKSVEPNQPNVRRVQIYNPSPADAVELNVVPKTDEVKQSLSDALMGHYLFQSLSEEDLTQIVDCMRPMEAAAGEVIIKQGDPGDLFYCLESGTASAMVEGVGRVMTYTERGCFGELALLYNSPRAASIVASTACKLWTIDVRTFKYILTTTSSSTMALRCAFLKKCPFLEMLSVEQVSRLAEALEIKYYEAGDTIVRQGEVADSFFIIEEGTVKCTQFKANGKELDLITLHAGDYFGEMGLILNESRHANCIAQSPVKCLTLNAEKFDLLLGHARKMMARRMRIRILQSVPLLSKLSEAKLMKFAGVMKVQAFTDGTYIIREGEEGHRFYIIAEGEARCTVTKDGVEQEVATLYPQQYFGERALVSKESRVANVIAVGTVECLVLDRDSFNSLLADVHDDITDTIARRDLGEILGKRSSDIMPAPEQTTFEFADFTPLKTVGTGTFGRVKLVCHTPTGDMYALKCMNKQEIVQLHQERNTLNEKVLLFECSASPFVLKLFQTFNTPHQIFMLMEFVQGGELWSYIYESKMKGTIPRDAATNSFTLPAVKVHEPSHPCHTPGLFTHYSIITPSPPVLRRQRYYGVSAHPRARHCVSGPQAGELALGPPGVRKGDRLWLRQAPPVPLAQWANTGQDVYCLRDPGVPGARNHHVKRLRQGGRLLGAGMLHLRDGPHPHAIPSRTHVQNFPKNHVGGTSPEVQTHADARI